jgi:hypothetical protein
MDIDPHHKRLISTHITTHLKDACWPTHKPGSDAIGGTPISPGYLHFRS